MKLLCVASILASLCSAPGFAGVSESKPQQVEPEEQVNQTEEIEQAQQSNQSAQQDVDASAAVKVDLCHFDATDAVWLLISVPQGAANSHLRRHDDAVPGGITAITQTQLDADCLPVEAVEPAPASAEQAEQSENSNVQ